MISKIFRVLFSFKKKKFSHDTVLSVILAGVFFLVTAAKLVKKLQFRNMKVSAFAFRKEAKKMPNCAALRWFVCGLLYVAVSARGLYYNMATHWYTSPFKSTYFEQRFDKSCLTAHQSWWSITYDLVYCGVIENNFFIPSERARLLWKERGCFRF